MRDDEQKDDDFTRNDYSKQASLFETIQIQVEI